MIPLVSNAFEHKSPIPRKYSAEGDNVSPSLTWSGAPENTREFVLICDDPDAPTPTPWVHWLVYGLPGDATSIPEGKLEQGVQGTNTKGDSAYMGPLPPPGHGVHHYHFKLYALGKSLNLAPGVGKQTLIEAMEGHILDHGELIGTYER